MAFFVQRDVTCNRCQKVYPTFSGEKELAVVYEHTYFSICPDCTLEVMKAMGYESIAHMQKMLMGIKEAETKNNRKRNLREGVLCNKCEKKFAPEEVRVRRNDCSNVEAWHLACYDKRNEVQGAKGEGVGGS